MPELPEAETIARELHKQLSNQTLIRVLANRRDVFHGPSKPERCLPGKRVVEVFRRGKRVVLRLHPDGLLVVRLGMTGRLTICPTDRPVELHTHLRMTFGDRGLELRFRDPRRFGGVWFHEAAEMEHDSQLGNLGLEPLEVTLHDFRRALSRGRQIKALLMDQAVIAGLGNIYSDESLHAAGLHPLNKADTLDFKQTRRLLRAIKTTLRRAVRFNGTTFMDYRRTDGEAGSFQEYHRVYQREGRPCRMCGTPIVRITAAGRATFFCPACQRVQKSRRLTGRRQNLPKTKTVRTKAAQRSAKAT